MTAPRGTYAILLGGLALLLAAAFVLSLVIGPAAIAWRPALAALVSGVDDPMVLVMQEIRLPRALLALLVGAILGLSGAVLQGLLRNPLAEPGLLGIGSSASLGAVISVYSGLAAIFPYALPLCAMAGALLAVALIQLLASRGSDSLSLILAGIAVATLSGALTSLALNLSPNPFAALEIVFWMMGSLADRSMVHVALAAPFILLGAVMLFAGARGLDALTLGEDVARSLGIRLERVRLLATLGTALGVGAATAVSGAIGFVGLIVPHILRPLVGGMPSRLLPASALGGACLLLLADTAVRVILPDKDLKLGVVTALIGVPFFIVLLRRARRAVS
ncbi:MAG: FecCD family ABC transporter permease [Parvibaculaceae bacterium]